jgi:hypothetical protein
VCVADVSKEGLKGIGDIIFGEEGLKGIGDIIFGEEGMDPDVV